MKIRNLQKTIWIVSVLLPCLVIAREIVPSNGIETLVIEHTEGTIQISASSDDNITFDVEKLSTDKNCDTSYKRSDNLYKIITKESWGSVKNCKVNLTIRIPQNMAIQAKIGFGNFQIEKISGKIDLNLGTGNLTAEIFSKDIAFDIGVGSADLRWNSLPGKMNLSGKIGMGQLGIKLPAKTVIDASIKTGIGRYVSALKQDDGSPYKMDLETGVGNINIE